MARIRTVKPDFFRHERLFEAELATGLPLRIAYAGMWTVADREGRFRWRPRVLKLDVLPFDDVSFDEVLNALVAYGFLCKYQIGADTFGCIPSFADHQHVNLREAQSEIPAPSTADADTCAHVQAHGEQEREQEGKGTLTMPADAGGAPEENSPAKEAQFSVASVTPMSESELDELAFTGKQRYPAEFEELWQCYRDTIGAPNSTKADAFSPWKRLSGHDREACFVGLSRYCLWVIEERKKRPDTPAKHLATFINKRGWEPFMEMAA